MPEQDKMPTPVAWADLKVGETYWVFQEFNDSLNQSPCIQKGVGKLSASRDICLDCPSDWLYIDEISEDPQGRPMIYGDDEHGTGAEKAVAAMKIALDQWLEGVGK